MRGAKDEAELTDSPPSWDPLTHRQECTRAIHGEYLKFRRPVPELAPKASMGWGCRWSLRHPEKLVHKDLPTDRF